MTALCMAAGALMEPTLHHSGLLLLLVVVLASTALGGLRAGLLTTALGAVASAYLLLEPRHDLAVAAPADRTILASLTLAGVAIGVLGARLRRTAILARARASVAQRQAEAYRLAIEATQDAVWDWDKLTDRIAWSDAIASVFGWTDAVRGTDTSWWLERVHPGDRDRVAATLQAIIDRGDSSWSWAEGYRFQRADGSYADVLDRGGWLTRDARGQVVRMVGAMLDVTERRQAERALRESEAKYLAIFELNMVPMCIRHEDGRVLEANDAYLRLTGYTREDLRAGRIAWSAFTLPGELHRDQRAMQEIRELGTCPPYEKIYALPDGRRVPVLIGGSRLDNLTDRAISFVLDLSALKRAEESLRESELRFRQLAENTRDVFWIVDLNERRVIYVSPAYEQIWGMSCAAVCADYQVWEDSIHAEDRARAVSALSDNVRYGPAAEEYRLFTPEGQMRWVRDRAFPVPDESGQVYRIAGIAEDITERRQAEADQRFLIDLAERMSRTSSPTALMDLVTSAVAEHLEVTHCAFCEVDAGGERLRLERGRGLPASVATMPMSPLCEHVLADVNDGRVVVSADVSTDPRTPAPWRECCRACGIQALVVVPLLRNGAWTAMLWVGNDHARTWTDAEVTLLRTVAERAWLAVENARLLEQTLAALQERDASLRALQDSDMRLGLALEAARVGTYDWDMTTDSMICSPGYAVLFGRAPGTFARCGAELHRAIHPEDRPRIERNLAVAIAQRQELRDEYRVIWPDGSIHWLEGRSRLIHGGEDQGARAVRVLGALVDTTDRKAMEAERARLLAREQAARASAEAANQAKDEFLAMLSHELRNPLNAIGNAVAVLAQIGDGDALLVRARDVIHRQLRHLAGLVDDLLDVARVTSGKIVIERRPLDLGDAVGRSPAMTASPGHRITAALQPVWVDGDETRIEQIIGNLVTNAIKYTPAGGTISVTVRPEGEHAVLAVQDTGIGISGDMLPRIFDLFTQGRRGLDRAQGGLGIGLTLVRRLVELHGGSIDAASEGPGCGSTFTMRLPRIAEPAAAPPADLARPDVGVVRRRVLVIEDNADIREMLQCMVERAGHEVQVAGDGPGGVARALSMRPHVVVADVGLPGFDGYEVARRIRATDSGKEMVLLALTGYGQDTDRRAALAAGFDYHLVKPVEPKVLLALLTRATARS